MTVAGRGGGRGRLSGFEAGERLMHLGLNQTGLVAPLDATHAFRSKGTLCAQTSGEAPGYSE